MKTNKEGRDCLKRGAWTVCSYKGGGGDLARKTRVVFFRKG